MTKKGFTLAEVLVTLGIIGVVVAITLSVLISEYRKQVTVNKLRHVYSLLKNAESMAVKDYGDMRNWDFIDLAFNQHPS
jgi:prepilin-type cleavage/methylation N-terminal domain protein